MAKKKKYEQGGPVEGNKFTVPKRYEANKVTIPPKTSKPIEGNKFTISSKAGKAVEGNKFTIPKQKMGGKLKKKK